MAVKHVKCFETRSRLFKSNQKRTVPQLEWSDLKCGELLGNGAFSSVYLANIPKLQEKNDSKESNIISARSHQYAIKTMRPKHEKDDDTFEMCAVMLILEAKLLANIQHKNIVQLHGVKAGRVSHSFLGKGYFMVLERLRDTLDHRLKKWRRYQKEPLILSRLKNHDVPSLPERIESIVVGVAQAMEYLHRHHIIYRDLKPQNIGFDGKNNVKIYDFGVAREMDVRDDSAIRNGRRLTGEVGTKRYM